MFHVCLCYAVLSVPCSLVITGWERAGLLALLCVVFSCVFVTFLYGVLGQVWYLIVLIPELCLPLNFHYKVKRIYFTQTLRKTPQIVYFSSKSTIELISSKSLS